MSPSPSARRTIVELQRSPPASSGSICTTSNPNSSPARRIRSGVSAGAPRPKAASGPSTITCMFSSRWNPSASSSAVTSESSEVNVSGSTHDAPPVRRSRSRSSSEVR